MGQNMKKYISPDPTGTVSDAQMLQQAIDQASEEGVGCVVIPRINPRTGQPCYLIGEPLLLPSDMEIVLNHCYLKLEDGMVGNIFRNRNMFGPDFGKASSEQQNIIIRGEGHAVLDGAGHNDIFEWSSVKDGNPHVCNNNLILFHNVDHFAVENIEVRNQRWWALNFIYCSNGYIADIVSRAKAEFSNQDGINLRSGCHHIVIERISGCSGDDFIALSAIGHRRYYQTPVEGKEDSIHDVVIRDIIGTSAHEGIVTLRCHDEREMYGIQIENIMESDFGDRNYLPYGTILVGQNYFFAQNMGAHGCTHHIDVDTVYTASGGSSITVGNSLTDSSFTNIRAKNCINAVTTRNYDHRGSVEIVERGYGEDGIKMERVRFEGILAEASLKGSPIDFTVMRKEDYLSEVTISNLQYEGPHPGILLNEEVKNDLIYKEGAESCLME